MALSAWRTGVGMAYSVITPATLSAPALGDPLSNLCLPPRPRPFSLLGIAF